MKSTTWESTRRTPILALALLLVLGGPAWAKKGGTGGGGGGGKGNGNGDDITPARITFADELGIDGGRISGDGRGEYVHGVDEVEVYLGSGGAQGDIFFRLGNAPARGLYLDFTDCFTDPLDCNPPYAAMVDWGTSIAVAPGDVVASGDGLFGIPAGESIVAPVEIFYSYTGVEGPGKIFFDPGLKGKNSCKNKSLYVTVTRPGPEELWIVSADSTTPACATLPASGGYSGQYDMSFAFTIETLR